MTQRGVWQRSRRRRSRRSWKRRRRSRRGHIWKWPGNITYFFIKLKRFLKHDAGGMACYWQHCPSSLDWSKNRPVMLNDDLSGLLFCLLMPEGSGINSFTTRGKSIIWWRGSNYHYLETHHKVLVLYDLSALTHGKASSSRACLHWLIGRQKIENPSVPHRSLYII